MMRPFVPTMVVSSAVSAYTQARQTVAAMICMTSNHVYGTHSTTAFASAKVLETLSKESTLTSRAKWYNAPPPTRQQTNVCPVVPQRFASCRSIEVYMRQRETPYTYKM